MRAVLEGLPFLSMSKPKFQHYVPDCDLKNFADEIGYLHCFDTIRNTTYTRKSYRVFGEKHMYIRTKADGSKSSETDDRLGELESEACPIVQTLIDCARQRKLPDLRNDEIHILRRFLLAQLTRIPWARAVIIKNEVQTMQERHGEKFEPSVYEREQIRQAWVKHLLTAPEGETKQTFFSKGLVVGYVRDARKKALAIGDYPIVVSCPRGIDPTHPNAEIIMPVASDVAMSFYGEADHRDLLPYDSIVNAVNRVVCGQSELFASRSRELTEALRRRRQRARKNLVA